MGREGRERCERKQWFNNNPLSGTPPKVIEAVPDLVDPVALSRVLASIKAAMPDKDPFQVREWRGGGREGDGEMLCKVVRR